MKRKMILVSVLALFASLLTCTAQIKVSILGDSYSTFVGNVYPESNKCWYGTKDKRADQSQNDVTKVEETWWRLLIEKMNARVEYNNSYSGATVCHRGYDHRDFADRSFVTRMYNLGNPDVIFVLGGTNDAWAGVAIGENQFADWTNQDLFQFRPAFCYLLHHLKLLYPKAKIYNISNCDLKKEVTGAMDEICKHYDVPNIQLEKVHKLGGHPSVKGMQMICDQVYTRLK